MLGDISATAKCFNIRVMEGLQQRSVLPRKEQILQLLEEQGGPEARRLFEGFVAQLKKLEPEQNGVSVSSPLLKMVPTKAS